MLTQPMSGILVALAAGALIGLEREQSSASRKERRLAGIRTFPVIALAGALCGVLVPALGVWPVVAAMLTLAALLAIAHHHSATHDDVHGITTEVAALITFLLGLTSTTPELLIEDVQRYLVVLGVAAATMTLLSVKAPLHAAVARLASDDMYAIAKLAIVALVLLPLLPNETYGPYDVLNPFDVGVMVVLIAGISFVGYFATRFIGAHRALLFSGIAGGLASSTAVTVSLSQRVRETPAALVPAAAAIIAAASTMFVRIIVAVSVVDAALVRSLVWPLGVMAALGLGLAGISYSRAGNDDQRTEQLQFKNPFALRPALVFGVLYSVILVLAKAASEHFGARGLYVSSLLAGTTDVDAITLSVARLHRGGLESATAATAITLAAVTNTLVKVGIAAATGTPRLALVLLGALGAVLGAGALVMVLAG